MRRLPARRMALAAILAALPTTEYGVAAIRPWPGSRVMAQVDARPNVLLVIADDFGVDTSPCYATGTEKPTMPTLTRLCEQGVVFDRFWSAPECSPTRAMILTGKYGFRTGVGSAMARTDSGLSTDELSLHKLATRVASVPTPTGTPISSMRTIGGV